MLIPLKHALVRTVHGRESPEALSAGRRSAVANSLAFLLIAAGYVLLRLSARPGTGFL